MPPAQSPTVTPSPSGQGATTPSAAAQNASPTSQGPSSNSAASTATQGRAAGSSNNSTAPAANGAAVSLLSSATTSGTVWQAIFTGPPSGQIATALNSSNAPISAQNWLGSTNGTSSRPRNHDEFYFSDGNALLQAEDVLFRVHWSVLTRPSKDFERMSATTTNIFAGGAISLGFTAASDFERLLTVLYHHVPAKHLAWSADEWISVMELAQRWGMQHIKDHAVQQLSTIDMPPVMKIMLGQKYKFSDAQLVPAYAALCITDEPLSVDTLNKLGSNAFVKVVAAREKLKAVLLTTAPGGSLFEGKVRSALAEQIVESVFFPRHQGICKLL